MTDATIRYFRAVSFQDMPVRRGQYITCESQGLVSGRAFEVKADGSDAQRLASAVGLMFRFRRTGTAIYDNYTTDRESVSVENKVAIIDGATAFVAKRDYDHCEMVAFVEHGPLSDGYATGDVDRLSVEDVTAAVLVSDYVANSIIHE